MLYHLKLLSFDNFRISAHAKEGIHIDIKSLRVLQMVMETKLSSQTSQRKKRRKTFQTTWPRRSSWSKAEATKAVRVHEPLSGEKGCLPFTSIFDLIVLKA